VRDKTRSTMRRYINHQGYVMTLCKDHPQANTHGYVLEHRLVMEGLLNRKLKPFPHEVVHHKNGIKHDNRPENLELSSNKEHCSVHSIGESNPRFIDRCNLLVELRRVSSEIGGAKLSAERCRKLSRYSVVTYQNRFGNWNNAKREAGIK